MYKKRNVHVDVKIPRKTNCVFKDITVKMYYSNSWRNKIFPNSIIDAPSKMIMCNPLLNLAENKQPGEADSISYSSLARIAWSTALTLQILLCQSGLGGFVNSILSWNGWLVLARLTYSVYLLHLGLLRVLAVILRHPFYFNPDFELVRNISCQTASF